MKSMRCIATVLLAHCAAGALAQSPAFRCGGVGQDDQQSIKAEAARHGLLLTFSTPGGAYIADVEVEVRRGDQLVLQGRCTGPLMLLDLAPPGSYEVRASAQGREQRKTVTVGDKPSSLGFVWPAP
jgi:hypothetical protein